MTLAGRVDRATLRGGQLRHRYRRWMFYLIGIPPLTVGLPGVTEKGAAMQWFADHAILRAKRPAGAA